MDDDGFDDDDDDDRSGLPYSSVYFCIRPAVTALEYFLIHCPLIGPDEGFVYRLEISACVCFVWKDLYCRSCPDKKVN